MAGRRTELADGGDVACEGGGDRDPECHLKGIVGARDGARGPTRRLRLSSVPRAIDTGRRLNKSVPACVVMGTPFRSCPKTVGQSSLGSTLPEPPKTRAAARRNTRFLMSEIDGYHLAGVSYSQNETHSLRSRDSLTHY